MYIFKQHACQCFVRLIIKASYNTKVPIETHVPPHSPIPWTMTPERYKLVLVNQDTPETLRSKAKLSMLKHFYQEAPIPLALRFNDRIKEGCEKTSKYLDDEMNAYLDSGVSSILCDESNEVVGCGLNRIWERNDDYRIDLVTDVRKWHNLAAKNVSNKDSVSAVLDWRDHQRLHIYNLGQKLLSMSSKNYAIYFGMAYITPNARSEGLSSVILIRTMMKNIDYSDSLVFFQSNFSSWDKSVYKIFPNIKIIDQVLYKDQELVVNRERYFQKIEHLHGLKFFATLM